jgi:dTDP-glucose 4,6-dehydratase
MKKITVLGSNSFSGATFAAYALSQGYKVLGMSRSPEPSDVLLPYKWADHAGFRFVQADMNHDLERIMDALNAEKPSVVVNFAAQSMVAQSWEHPEQWMMTNVVSSVKLHDRLRQVDWLEKYVQISTPEVYGSTAGVINEDLPYNPSTPYAVSKAACDMSLQTFLKAYDFPVVFTRAANVCGPGQPLYRIIPRTIFCIMSGEKLQLHGGGTSVRSFIHMRDVSAGTLLAAEQAEPGKIYHFSTDERVSIRELVERICRKMEVDFDEYVELTGDRLGKDAAYLLDASRAQNELGWQVETPLDTILDECITWMRGSWDEIQRQPKKYIHKA